MNAMLYYIKKRRVQHLSIKYKLRKQIFNKIKKVDLAIREKCLVCSFHIVLQAFTMEAKSYVPQPQSRSPTSSQCSRSPDPAIQEYT
jgi:hypothetical protein